MQREVLDDSERAEIFLLLVEKFDTHLCIVVILEIMQLKHCIVFFIQVTITVALLDMNNILHKDCSCMNSLNATSVLF